MSAVLIGTYHPGTPAWTEMRRRRIGGSDIAAICGLSKWQSAYSLWHEKRNEIDGGPDKPQLEWGTRLEPVIIQAWEERHPEFQVSYQPGHVYAHPEREWQVASPDALLSANPTTFPAAFLGGVEAKTSRYDDLWGKDGSEDIPAYYSTQVQWCMDVFDVDTWHVAALFAGSDYREYLIRANPNLQELLRETASDFLDSLAQDRVSPIDGHDSTYQAVRDLHPDLVDEDVEVGDVGRTWVQAERELAAAKEAAKEAKARLADELGNRRRALVDGQRVAYRKNAGANRPPVLTAVNGLLDKVGA